MYNNIIKMCIFMLNLANKELFFMRFFQLFKRYFLILTTLFLVSCGSDAEYEMPEKQVPAKFVMQNIIDDLSNNIPQSELNLQWWKDFKDPLLNRIVEDAINNNLDIMEGFESLREAEIKYDLVGIDNKFKATLSGQMDVLEEHNISGVTGKETTRDNLAGLTISFSPDFFGKEKPERTYAMAEVEFKRSELRGTILKVTANITSEYIALRGSQEQLELLKESIKLQEQTLEAVKERYKAGISPELDYQKAVNAVEVLKAGVPTLEETISQKSLSIANMIGSNMNSYVFLLSKPKPSISYRGTIPNVIPLDILDMRPDIRQSEANVKKSLANIGIADAARYPSFTIGGQISIGSQKISSTSMADILIGSLSAVIEKTLFDSGKTELNVKLAKKHTDIAMIRYQRTLNNSIQEVENSLISIKTNAAKIERLNKALAASKRSSEQAQILYKNGIIDFLDLIDSQRSYTNNKLALSETNTIYSSEVTRLFLALGYGQ